MARRGVSILAGVLLIAMVGSAVGAGLVDAQTDQPDYSLEDLEPNGRHPSAAPDSIRLLGDPVRGSISLRYQPANPLQSSERGVFISPGERIQTDQLIVRTTAFEDAVGNYTLRLVYWQRATRTVETANGTVRQEPYAAKVRTQTETFRVPRGYGAVEIELRSHYEETWQVTAILLRDGEPVDGARWRFRHSSLQSAQPVPGINSKGDVWGWAAAFVVFPGVIGIVGGLAGAWQTLEQTGTGPRISRRKWVVGLLFGALLLVGTAYYQLSAILANAPVVLGGSLGIVAYVAGLRYRPEIENIVFDRMELGDAKPLRNYEEALDREALEEADGGPDAETLRIKTSEYREELYKDLIVKPTVKINDTRLVPKSGLRPFLARLFADAATLDISDLRTGVMVDRGNAREVIYCDPEADPAVEHTPARLRRRTPVWHRTYTEVEDEETGATKRVPREDLTTADRAMFAALTALVVVGLPAAGWVVAGQLINAPSVGLVVGTLPAIVDAYTAEDGSIEYEAAPINYRAAQATATVLRREYADSRTLEEEHKARVRAELRTEKEARAVERRRDETLIEEGHDRKVTPARERQTNGTDGGGSDE